jgi:drug/metabolite transporter (DMT)-like permease
MPAQVPRVRPAPSLWLLIACLAAVYIIWGTTYFGIKVAISGMPPFFLVGTRFLAAGTLLLSWQALRRKPLPTLRQWFGAAVIGLLLLVAGNGAVTVAERWVSSGAAVAMISVMPLATALWSGLLGQWPRRMEWGAILLGGLGAALMLMGRDLRASLLGTVIILFGVCCWSLGTVLSRRIEVPEGPTGFAAEMLVAGVVGLAISIGLGEHPTQLPGPKALAAWLYLVVFGSLIAFSAYRYLVERVSPTLAATYAYVNPPVGLLVGWWLGNESFSPSLLLGLPIVLAAVALHAWIQMRAKATAQAAQPLARDAPGRAPRSRAVLEEGE